MPQLDVYSYMEQSISLIILFIIYHIIMKKYIYPSIYEGLKIEEYNININKERKRSERIIRYII